MAGGHVWWGDAWQGHAWHRGRGVHGGGCMWHRRDLCGRGSCVAQGASMAGDMCGGGVMCGTEGPAWWGACVVGGHVL